MSVTRRTSRIALTSAWCRHDQSLIAIPLPTERVGKAANHPRKGISFAVKGHGFMGLWINYITSLNRSREAIP